MIGPQSPTSDVDRLAQTIRRLDTRVAELELAVARPVTHVSGLLSSRSIYTSQSGGNDDAAGALATWPIVNTRSVDVPVWAVKALVTAVIGQAWAITSDLNHSLTVRVGDLASTSRRIRWSTAGVPAGGRQELTLAAEFDVSGIAGTTVTLRTAASRVSGSGGLRVDGESIHTLDIEFRGP